MKKNVKVRMADARKGYTYIQVLFYGLVEEFMAEYLEGNTKFSYNVVEEVTPEYMEKYFFDEIKILPFPGKPNKILVLGFKNFVVEEQ